MAVNDITDRTAADALIPVSETKEIIKSLPSQSAALSLMRRVTMSTKKDKQPVLSALPQAYWVTGDTGLKQTTKAEWDNKFLEAEELAVIVPVPEAVLDDSDFDIWGEVRPLLIEAFGVKIDEAALFGVDNPWSVDSIVEGAEAAGNELVRGSVGGQDVAGDIIGEGGVMSLVEEDGHAVNGFAARTGFRAALRGLRDENGGLLFQPSLQAGTPSTLVGEPIRYVDANGAFDSTVADLIAGDWRKAILGIRQDITFKIFTEGVISDDDGAVVLNLMQQDSAAMRAVMRVGFQVANPINRQQPTEADRYPFAVLRPTNYS